MTDKDIIKALKCIAGEDAILCAECAFANVEFAFRCRKNVAKAAIDHIKRQQAEIERLIDLAFDLTEDNEARVADNHDLRVELKTAKAEAIREFAKRMKEKVDVVYSIKHLQDTIDHLVKEMTEEA